MIPARGFAQAPLTQDAALQQTMREAQQIGGLPGEQLQLQFADRLLMFARLHFAAIEGNLNLTLSFLDHPAFTGKIGAEQRLDMLRQRGRKFPLRPDLRRQALKRQLRFIQWNIVFRALVQAAHHPTGDFQRHLITPLIAADAQPHVVTTQPVIGGFVINVQQLARGRMFRLERIELLAQRLYPILSDDKLKFDFLSHD